MKIFEIPSGTTLIPSQLPKDRNPFLLYEYLDKNKYPVVKPNIIGTYANNYQDLIPSRILIAPKFITVPLEQCENRRFHENAPHGNDLLSISRYAAAVYAFNKDNHTTGQKIKEHSL